MNDTQTPVTAHGWAIVHELAGIASVTLGTESDAWLFFCPAAMVERFGSQGFRAIPVTITEIREGEHHE